MLTIPSMAKAFAKFSEEGRVKPSSFHDRVVDVKVDLFKFTLLSRNLGPYRVDRYSERKERAEERSQRVDQRAF